MPNLISYIFEREITAGIAKNIKNTYIQTVFVEYLTTLLLETEKNLKQNFQHIYFLNSQTYFT